MDEVLKSVLSEIQNLPMTALLILVLIGGYRGWWVYGPVHTRMVEDLGEELDDWKTVAQDATTALKGSVRTLETRKR